VETYFIAGASGVSFVAYVFSLFYKPEYLPLPEEKSDEQFLELLKSLSYDQNKKICAYC